jgi:DNA mismatch endonuclease (patch repair protein)
MADVHTPAARYRNMAAIGSKDTKPELVVRRLVHGLGYRYRLHQRNLPGKPDLVFASRHKIIEVRGCFWHVHACPKGRSTPVTNAEFWRGKRLENKGRDARNRARLRRLGWEILVIWECEIGEKARLRQRITCFLERAAVMKSHAAVKWIGRSKRKLPGL